MTWISDWKQTILPLQARPQNAAAGAWEGPAGAKRGSASEAGDALEQKPRAAFGADPHGGFLKTSSQSQAPGGPQGRKQGSGPEEKGRFSSFSWFALRLAALFGVGLLALRLPIPLVVMEPGPTTDVAKLIQIETTTFKSKGSYLLTTALVSSTDGVTLPDAVSVFFDPEKELISRESIFPSGSTRVNTDRVHAAQMTESQQEAAVAALHEIGMPSVPEGAFVRDVDGDAPAAGKLLPGDVIVAVEQNKVLEPADLKRLVGGRSAGEEVTVTVRRNESTKDIKVRTLGVKDGSGKGKTRLGVEVVPQRRLPVEISIDAGAIGGPSAGLIFAVAIYDALTPGDLTVGRQIAGTGGIANTKDKIGSVTTVGAVGEKVTAAGREGVDVFLVPKANLKEARAAAPNGLEIVAVSTLREAIKALRR